MRFALRLIRRVGVIVLFLPTYSLNLNPVEKMWSKVNALQRRIKARTPEKLGNAIGNALSKVTAEDALNWFVLCGYSFYWNCLIIFQ